VFFPMSARDLYIQRLSNPLEWVMPIVNSLFILKSESIGYQ
jgi:hypothetical protein